LFFKKPAVLACWLLRRDHETRKESRKERKKERKKEGRSTYCTHKTCLEDAGLPELPPYTREI
jgi:hypothetical protein